MIKLVIKDKIAIVQLNRPAQKNALSTLLLAELQNIFLRLQKDLSVSIIILKGDVDFSAGGDIKEMTKVGDRASAELLIEKVQAAFDTIYRTKKIVIAYTKGLVFGGGMELALASDIIFSHSNAQFSMPETALGIIPGAGGTQYLPRIIGQKNAAYMLLSGEVFSAKEMKRMGLVQNITDDFSETINFSEKLLKKDSDSLIAIKELLRTAQPDLKKEAEFFVDLLMKKGKDKISDFLANR